MKISIVASGSRGDVQPYIALGRGLKDAGFDVRLLTSDDFATLVTGAGLEFCSTGTSIEALLQSEEWRATTASGNFLKILARMQQEVKQRAQDLAVTMPPLLEGTNLIVAGMSGMGGTFSIAEKLRIPLIQAYVLPLTPTREFPGPLTPTLPLGQWLNPLSFHVARQLIWQSVRVADVAVRKNLSMPKASFWGPFQQLKRQQTPVLYGFSHHVLPRPKDWSEQHYVTGYWFLDDEADWMPEAELTRFLQNGAPPVYVGFGSMGSRNPEEVAEIALEALSLSGQRGVLASGWGGMRSSNLPENVYMLSSVPHSWLFPQMSAIVHHGGAGTTAASLRAGVPSLIVPFMGDQPFWGHRVSQLGVGTQPIPRRKLTAKRLADVIKQAVSDKAMQQRAAILGEKIQAEDGSGEAAAIIQRLIQR